MDTTLTCPSVRRSPWPSWSLPPAWMKHSTICRENRCVSHSAVFDSLRPHRLQLARLLCPWNLQARLLERAAIPFSRGSFWPRGSVLNGHAVEAGGGTVSVLGWGSVYKLREGSCQSHQLLCFNFFASLTFKQTQWPPQYNCPMSLNFSKYLQRLMN